MRGDEKAGEYYYKGHILRRNWRGWWRIEQPSQSAGGGLRSYWHLTTVKEEATARAVVDGFTTGFEDGRVKFTVKQEG